MVTEDTQQEEKVGLKRKLTGPPRLLLGKTRTRSIGEDRPEAKTGKVDESALNSPTAATEGEVTDLTEIPNMEEEALSGGRVKSCRGRRKVSSEEGDITYRKLKRSRWWRRFSSAVVCNRRQKKNVEESLEEKQNVEENNQSIHEEKERFNLTFRRVQTPSEVRARKHSGESADRDENKPSLSFQKKLRKFFTRAGRSRWSAVPQQTKPLSPPADWGEECFQGQNTATCLSSEAVTVMAEMSITASEDPAAAESATSPTQELGGYISNMEEHVVDPADGSRTTQTDAVTADLAPVRRPVEAASSDKDKEDDRLSTSPISSELRHKKGLQPSTNGPSIRIELVPPDNTALEDEEDDCWEGRSSENQNQHHLLLLLGFNLRELQLLQTAHALVRAALHAAVDQLSREEQGSSECPQGTAGLQGSRLIMALEQKKSS